VLSEDSHSIEPHASDRPGSLSPPVDPFRDLMPAAAPMPIAADLLRVPGVPAGFELSDDELHAPEPMARFHRRTIQLLDCAAGDGDRLVLVDKAIPHARFDLMLSEASPTDKPTPADVQPATGQALWRSGLEFVRFVSAGEQQQAFDLTGGQLHLALNCDPNTRDRESVQAAKQFHLHLLYWTAAELAPLRRAGRLDAITDGRLRRQLLDPLAFLGARLITESIADLELGIPGAVLLESDDAAVTSGLRPPGCVLRLPGWQVLGMPAFEDLIRRLHKRLQRTGADLLDTFTGRRSPPEPWQRHPLRPLTEIDARADALGFSPAVRAGLHTLARGLRDLSARQAAAMRRAAPAARRHCMVLNQPCYALNLYTPKANGPDSGLIEAGPLYLIIQTKLFSGIGGAGLLTLNGIPSVRVVRGCGRFSERDWHRRADFQRAFAEHNAEALRPLLRAGSASPRRFRDLEQGWV
jgi:hypothetical protein